MRINNYLGLCVCLRGEREREKSGQAALTSQSSAVDHRPFKIAD